jgi:hypothetical protein
VREQQSADREPGQGEIRVISHLLPPSGAPPKLSPFDSKDADEYAAMQRCWGARWGDRRQELALIGSASEKRKSALNSTRPCSAMPNTCLARCSGNTWRTRFHAGGWARTRRTRRVDRNAPLPGFEIHGRCISAGAWPGYDHGDRTGSCML